MRDYQLKIEPFEYVALQNVEIHKGINYHAGAEVTIRIKDDKKEEYLSMLSTDIWLNIIWVTLWYMKVENIISMTSRHDT